MKICEINISTCTSNGLFSFLRNSSEVHKQMLMHVYSHHYYKIARKNDVIINSRYLILMNRSLREELSYKEDLF